MSTLLALATYVGINRWNTYPDLSPVLKTSTDLLGGPILAQIPPDKTPQARGFTPMVVCRAANSPLGRVLCMISSIVPFAATTTNFPINRASMYMKHSSNSRYRQPLLNQQLNLVTFFMGEVRVTHRVLLSSMGIEKGTPTRHLTSLDKIRVVALRH